MSLNDVRLKWQLEIANIDKEIQRRKNTRMSIRYLQGMRLAISLMLSDLKNLPNELKGVSNNEQKEKVCANYENTIHTDTDLCDNCGERKGKH